MAVQLPSHWVLSYTNFYSVCSYFLLFDQLLKKLDDILALCPLSIRDCISLNCCLEFHETLWDSLRRQWKVGGSNIFFSNHFCLSWNFCEVAHSCPFLYWVPYPHPITWSTILSINDLNKGYRYHKLRKTFSKFYRRYYDLISKFQVGLKSLLRQGLSEPDFYGDLVYKLKKIVGSNNFSAQFIKIISHYKKIGYNINVLQQTACLVVNPITVGNFAFLFNCTPVGRTSDSMMVPT